MFSERPVTTILCAGPGLGFYVPGIIMNRQLKKKHIPSVVHVFEAFLIEAKKANVRKTKAKFHENFSYALMAQNLAKDPTPYLDEDAIKNLLDTWEMEQRDAFVVFSGFWISVLQRFVSERNVSDISIDLCHVDADHSTSWKLFDTTPLLYHHVWFNNWERKSVDFHMNITEEPAVPFKKRKNEFVIHGGGWGMGTYKDKITSLNSLGFQLNIIAYEPPDPEDMDPLNKYFLLDPEWNTWDLNAMGENLFPPLCPIKHALPPDFSKSREMDHPLLYDIIRESKAIISKPGAGTLMDSISSATPLIILEPFGAYENKNGLLWKHFGLGISLEEWAASGYSEEILEKLHHNLLEVSKTSKNYIESYIKSNTYGIQDR